jgi:hypothetical protein
VRRVVVVVACVLALTCLGPVLAAPAAAQGKTVTSAQVVGSWKSPGLDCESITFAADGTFSSYLHDRPFDEGRWELTGTTLVIKGNAGAERVTDLTRKGKRLTGKLGGKRVVWTRI